MKTLSKLAALMVLCYFGSAKLKYSIKIILHKTIVTQLLQESHFRSVT